MDANKIISLMETQSAVFSDEHAPDNLRNAAAELWDRNMKALQSLADGGDEMALRYIQMKNDEANDEHGKEVERFDD